MAPFVVRKPGGTLIPLVSELPLRGIAEGAEQRWDLLSTDTVTLTVNTNYVILFGIGDTMEVYGQLYTLNVLPTVRREGANRLVYELSFEGPQYHLLRVQYFDTTAGGNALSPSFALTGNLALFAQVLFANMARVFGGAWGLGEVKALDSTGVIDGSATLTKTLTFENENCLAVLQRLCTEFNTEFEIEYRPNDAPNRILHIKTAGSVQPDVFSYGQGNGLYTLSRQSVGASPFFTRLYVFGGSKNIPLGYRDFATRLQLPTTKVNGPYSPFDSLIENSSLIAEYGLIEGTKVFEEVFPHFVGTVTYASDVEPEQYFADAEIGFNPRALDPSNPFEIIDGATKLHFKYLVDGLTPKVSFLSGNLAGYSFDLVDFYENNGIIRIKPYTDAQGLVFPNPDPANVFRIQVGDTYTLIDMKMPDEYITAAENKLLAVGQAYFSENNQPALKYGLTLDELYLQNKAGDVNRIPLATPPNFYRPGDTLRVIDAGLNIDQSARIISLSRDLLRPYKYTLELGDTPKTSLVEKILAQQAKIKILAQQAPQSVNTPTVDDVKREVTDGIVDFQNTVFHRRMALVPLGFEPLTPTGKKFGANVYNDNKKVGAVLSSIREQLLLNRPRF